MYLFEMSSIALNIYNLIAYDGMCQIRRRKLIVRSSQRSYDGNTIYLQFTTFSLSSVSIFIFLSSVNILVYCTRFPHEFIVISDKRLLPSPL